MDCAPWTVSNVGMVGKNAALRSVDKALKWTTEQLYGDFMKTVGGKVFGAFQEASLIKAGFHIPRVPLAAWAAGQDSLFCNPEDNLAAILGDFAMIFAGNSMKRCLWLLRGWSCRIVE